MKKKCDACQSCGMPFESTEDIAKEHSDLCVYCVNSDGKPKTYNEVLEGCASYFSESQAITKEAALKFSRQMLAPLPRWKGQKD